MQNDIYLTYVNEIKSYKLLTPEEEADLSKKISEGSEYARKQLINSNLRLVISIAKKFCDSTIPIMDLIQEGNIGLITAASKFSYTFNTRFSTYAYAWIMQYMLRYMHTKATFIHLPSRKKELLSMLNNARSFLFQRNGHEPSDEQLASYLGITEAEVVEMKNLPSSVISLDATYGDNNEMTISDNIADQSEGPEARMIEKERVKQIHAMMSTLPEMEQKVLYHRYNFENDKKTKTLREIGELLGVSAETVRQMEIRAIHRMKVSADASEMEESLLTA